MTSSSPFKGSTIHASGFSFKKPIKEKKKKLTKDVCIERIREGWLSRSRLISSLISLN